MSQLSSSSRESLSKRIFKDKLAAIVVGFGGVSVIFAIALIFFYFLYVVIPLFQSADQQQLGEYSVSVEGQVLALAIEEQTEVGVIFHDKPGIDFFRTKSGKVFTSQLFKLEDDTRVTSFTQTNFGRSSALYGLSNGTALAVEVKFDITYPDDVRLITPNIKFPLGEKAIEIDEQGFPLAKIAYQENADEASVVALTEDSRLLFVNLTKSTSFLTDEVSVEKSQLEMPLPDHEIDYILLDKEQRNLYLISNQGQLSSYDVSDKSEPRLKQQVALTKDVTITSVRFLTGDLSLLVGDSKGKISQWARIPVENQGQQLKRLREFKGELKGQVTDIAIEPGRRGFLATDDRGYVGLYHSTSERTLLVDRLSEHSLQHATMAPRANAMLVLDKQGQLQFIKIDNEHPEVSWKALWGKVWYESYAEPEYIWQSSSASDDFEPKLSLMPLTFGTMKAAFYAMLVAIPLAIFGALYAAQFMRPKMRQVVKPTIEIMEALPTVILGFLAGLWLAPFVETHLPGIFMMLLVLPIGILLASWLWERLPEVIRHAVPEGWEAALLLPVVLILVLLSMSFSPFMEQLWFNGNMRAWLSNDLGIGFDQRNAIVVGLAMGFAVIPTIFSIAEDAIFGVPKHLSNGSLAMGATTWQTLTRIVLPSASPGIFSGVMIGLGRAVGETMIVLMATGNTPVMDFSPFEGLRTLSANIAVELPESELGSTHFRVLFLAGLVLFMFTFVVNTAAELVRQRLRQKYSNL